MADRYANAWAETLPWDCLIRETNCVSLTHSHNPMVGDDCAWHGCGYTLIDGEVCYAVIELPGRVDGREQWVCWRHVRDAPLRIVASI